MIPREQWPDVCGYNLRVPDGHLALARLGIIVALRHSLSCPGVQGHFGQRYIGKESLPRKATMTWLETQQTGRCQSDIMTPE